MLRKLRVEYEGAIYHLMNRGDRREPIFLDTRSGRNFWKRRRRFVRRTVGPDRSNQRELEPTMNVTLVISDPFTLRAQFPSIQLDEVNIKPGQNGVDIVVNDADVGTVGFKYGEIKPNTISGQRTFNRQVQNWQNNGTLPQNVTVQPITYDANGNVYLEFNPAKK